MTMYDAINAFPKQFKFRPVIKNLPPTTFFAKKVVGGKRQKIIIAGMGGSQLAAELIKSLNLDVNILLHKDYGLPNLPRKELREYLVVLSSYSGNTEETIDAYSKAKKNKLPVIVITTGGKLLNLAQKDKKPFIKLPSIGIQPRCALGLSFLAILKAIGQNKAIKEAKTLAKILDPKKYEQKGRLLAKRLKGRTPIIYASNQNFGLAYNWKIKLNETGKVPAFCNVLPELNHNEMNAFDLPKITKTLGRNFHFIFLHDRKDHPRILKRMSVLEKLFLKRKLPVTVIEIAGKNAIHALFSSVILADWTAYYTALGYGVDPNEVPMVEEFKRMI